VARPASLDTPRGAGASAVADDQAKATRERNLKAFRGPFGAVYSFYMGRRWLNRIIAKLVWKSDIRPLFASMQAVSETPDGGTIIDAPCGAGVAFRALHPDRDVRYLAFDLSPAMLARARRRSQALGLRQVLLAEADAESLPVEDAIADLFLSYFGLHCFPHPDAAVGEIARCLRPGGRVVGSAIVQGDRLLDRLRVRAGKGAYGQVGTEADVGRWLTDAGLQGAEVEQRGVFAYFSAGKPPTA
jgi:SAM-dependent methyltransferase